MSNDDLAAAIKGGLVTASSLHPKCDMASSVLLGLTSLSRLVSLSIHGDRQAIAELAGIAALIAVVFGVGYWMFNHER